MKNKLLIKILGLLGYKLVNKNTFKNNRLISHKSFLTIERALNTIFENKKINNLIQIGANDGIRFDTLNHYIKKYKIKSLLVEPILENFEKLKKNYENYDFVKLENSAISVKDEISYLYKVDPGKISKYSNHIPGITSFDKKHLLKHGVKKGDIIIENVSSLTIKELINKNNLLELELLFVDAEGYDGKIINDFFHSTNLRPIIILEYIHIDNKVFEELVANLEIKKYSIFSINENLFCYPNEDINLIKFFI